MVENLDWDQILSISFCKGSKIIILKVNDEKIYFVKCEGCFE